MVVSCWLSTLKFLNTLNELIFLLVVNLMLLSLHCAVIVWLVSHMLPYLSLWVGCRLGICMVGVTRAAISVT